jgi:anthranilate phosphoribosyltransferase
MSHGIAPAIDKVARGESLDRTEAERAMEAILGGSSTTEQISALLMGLRAKGESIDEITGFASTMRRHATPIFPTGHRLAGAPLVDTCGTGGDGLNTFNISTAAAFVAAGAGARVAKHGNRSSSSRCGSADVLEALGVAIDIPVGRVAQAIEEIGIGFIYAPAMHSATRHAMPARRALGVRTIFNLLGPLTNPAGAPAQVMGVYAPHLVPLVAEAMAQLGIRHAFVVHGAAATPNGPGLDEISIFGPTHIAEVHNGIVILSTITPEEAGLTRAPAESLIGGDAQTNAAILTSIFSGEPGPRRDVVLLNAAAVLVAADLAPDLRTGAALAARTIDTGSVTNLLTNLRA